MAMSITFPPDLEATVQRLVESGRYDDSEAVLREAVRLLEEIERKRDELRAKLQIGIDEANRGELIEWTPELRQQIRESAHRRAAAGDRPHPDVCP
jgi:putative addiction module CopG family antidote